MGFRSVEGKCYFQGIDDAPYECNLDEFKDWDFLIDTDCQGNAEAVFQDIKSIVKYVLSTQTRESSIYEQNWINGSGNILNCRLEYEE